MKKQVIVIHGVRTFGTYKEYISYLKARRIDIRQLRKTDWKENLCRELGSGFEVVAPRMPNPTNAKYLEWKIWFKKLIPHIKNGVVFVGHSLGAVFLAKYLSENKFPKKIRGTFLVSASHDDRDQDYSLADFVLPKNLKLLEKQGGEIFLYHSVNDPEVPFADFEKYRKVLPRARVRVFKNRGHFTQETFPEIVRDIKSLCK